MIAVFVCDFDPQFANKGMSGLLVAMTYWRDVLRSATTMSGELCVMTAGVLPMRMWSVGNLDSQD